MTRTPLAIKPWRPRNAAEAAAAKRPLQFFERHLTHTKGRWVKRPFNVLAWQREQVLRPLFGRLRRDGTRQYRKAWIEVGKKSGKSELAAGIGLHQLLNDKEPMAEVYIGAMDRDQAGQIFNAAAQMVRASPKLRSVCRVLTSVKRIIVVSGPQAGSFLEALAADADSADGKSPSCIIFDEVHRYKGRDFYDTLIRSTAAREQPLVICLTTAGTDLESLGGKEHEYARQVLEGFIEDPELLVVIWAAAEGADILDWRAWRDANPSIGETVSWEYFEAEARKASEDPSNENSFRRFHLNQWVAQESRWMPMRSWDASAGSLDQAALLEQLKVWPSYGGLDLSQTRDLTALCLVMPPADTASEFRALWRFWMPEENIDRASKRDHVRYDLWVRDMWIRPTPGESIDYDTIEHDVRADCLRWPVQAIAYDPTFAWQLAQHLMAAGVQMLAIRQGFETMASPTADLLDLVKKRRFCHGGNPVARWMADNTVVEQDSLGRWRPSKRKATRRIDGIVAAIMGLDLCERATYGEAEAQEGVLVYNDPVQISPHI